MRRNADGLQRGTRFGFAPMAQVADEARPLTEVRPDVSAELWEVMAKMLAKAGVVKARVHNNPQKAQPKKKAQERAAAAAAASGEAAS